MLKLAAESDCHCGYFVITYHRYVKKYRSTCILCSVELVLSK